jgi:hypothetical protein
MFTLIRDLGSAAVGFGHPSPHDPIIGARQRFEGADPVRGLFSAKFDATCFIAN